MKKALIIILTILPLFAFSARSFKVDFIVRRVQVKKLGSKRFVKVRKDSIIKEGDIIRTGRGSIVKLIDPDGIKILLTAKSTLQIKSFKEREQQMHLFTGKGEFKVRRSSNFKVFTNYVVAGVRGTLFSVSTLDNEEQVVVYEGQVEVGNVSNPEQGSVLLREGGKVTWKPTEQDLSTKLIKAASNNDLKFRLETEGPKPTFDDYDSAKEIPEDLKDARPLDKIKKNKEPLKLKKTIEKPKNYKLGFNLGGIKQDNFYYHLIMFAPEFKLGKNFQIGLILPVMYDGRNSIYDVKGWGNHEEWSFSDTKDAIKDTLLKINYLKIREKGDIFYLAFGSLNNITLGSGFLINNFNTAPLFPAQRALAFEGGFDAASAGAYLFVNDVYDLEIMGARLFFRPLFGLPTLGKFEVGIEFMLDRKPLVEDNNPAVFAVALDIIFPIAKTKNASVILFADFGKQGVYYNNKPAGLSLPLGTDLVGMYINDSFGADAGLKGNITQYFSFMFRYYYLHGGYVADYIDRLYLLNRQDKAQQVLTPSLASEHGFKLMGGIIIPKLLEFNMGFYKKYSDVEPEDRLLLGLKTYRGAFYKFWLEAVYEKKYIDRFFEGERYNVNAILDIKLGYMITKDSDLVIRKVIDYDENGVQQSKLMLQTQFFF